MKYITGDLIELARNGTFTVIGHGCNCHCQMGAGIAKQIRNECLEAYMADRYTIPGDKSKLGSMTCATISPRNSSEHSYIVCNLYTQYDYTKTKIDVDYAALRHSMICLRNEFKNHKIGLPMIGAGLAGGDWAIIEKIIQEELEDHGVDVTIVRYKL